MFWTGSVFYFRGYRKWRGKNCHAGLLACGCEGRGRLQICEYSYWKCTIISMR
jgi:hypothetical protein